MIDASKSIDDLHKEINELAHNVIKEAGERPLGKLWTDLQNTVQKFEHNVSPPAKKLKSAENGVSSSTEAVECNGTSKK